VIEQQENMVGSTPRQRQNSDWVSPLRSQPAAIRPQYLARTDITHLRQHHPTGGDPCKMGFVERSRPGGVAGQANCKMSVENAYIKKEGVMHFRSILIS